MKNVRTVLIIMVMAATVSCQKLKGEGPLVTENRNVVDFSGVDLRCSAKVYYKQESNYKLEISAQQNILDVIITEVLDHKLVIRFKDDINVRSHEPITIIVSSPQVRLLRIGGSGNISTAGLITASRMDMEISGSGNLQVAELTTSLMDARINGSGNITVTTGTATEEKLHISGSGNIDLSGVAAQKGTVVTSGSGESRVFAAQQLDITISGSGSVYYKGNPVIKTSISGSGSVVPM